MMSEVLFALTVLTVNCEPYSKSRPHKHHAAPNRNQRIIKVQGPPTHYNHYHSIHHHNKPGRGTRPVTKHHGDRDDYIRPNRPPPIPPFFNGPSTNHIKHLPRPPPHVYHKAPSYGLGFPYKISSGFRTSGGSKDHFRVTSHSSNRPTTSGDSTGSISSSQVSTASVSSAYHSPTFKSPTYLPSPISHHIISSNDNNGPIREIPAPNLAPKHHDESFDGHILDGPVIDSDPSFFNTFDKDPGLEVNAIIKESGIDVNSVIKDDATLLYPKGPTLEISNFDQGAPLDVTNLVKDAPVMPEHSSGYEVTEHHNNLPSNDQIIKGHDGTKLYYAPDPDPSLPVHKVPPTSDPHSTPSNGQGINNVYLPQISHGFPNIPGGFVGGGSLSSQDLFHLMHGIPTVPAVIPQPAVAFVGQPPPFLSGLGPAYYQQGGVGPTGGQYPQHDQHDGNDISQYLAHPDIHNLLHNNPEYHRQQEQQSLGASHSTVVSQDSYPQQPTYSPQNQYQDYSQSQYQATYKQPDSSGDISKAEGFSNSGGNHNYQYEPEASESDIRNSLTVIRQTKEGSSDSGTVKDLLLEDSTSNDLNYQDKTSTSKSESRPIILQLKNIPEVPFYASLPNKKAAEAFASLQAAGSVASNYLNRAKITRKDQQEEVDEEQEEGDDSESLGLSQSHLSKPQKVAYKTEAKDGSKILRAETVHVGDEKTVVEIQPSVSIYAGKIVSKEKASDRTDSDETSEDDLEFSSEGQGQEEEEDGVNLDFKEDGSNETFGRRIRPKKK